MSGISKLKALPGWVVVSREADGGNAACGITDGSDLTETLAALTTVVSSGSEEYCAAGDTALVILAGAIRLRLGGVVYYAIRNTSVVCTLDQSVIRNSFNDEG